MSFGAFAARAQSYNSLADFSAGLQTIIKADDAAALEIGSSPKTTSTSAMANIACYRRPSGRMHENALTACWPKARMSTSSVTAMSRAQKFNPAAMADYFKSLK